MTRLWKEVAETVELEAAARDVSLSEYIAITVARAHGHDDVVMPPRTKPMTEQGSIDYDEAV
jgi:hypothetical protein